MKKAIFYSLLAITELYLFQFIVLPFLSFPDEDISFVLCLLVLYSVVIVTLISEKAFPFLLSDILYFTLVYIYHPPGAYGIGMVDLSLGSEAQAVYRKSAAAFDIFLRTVVLLIVQIFVLVLFRLIKYLIKMLNF